MDRDIVIERLERKLEERDAELRELRSGLQDFIKAEVEERLGEFEKRLSKLESKVVEVSGVVDGLVRELLDQKTKFKEITEKLETPKSVLTIEDVKPETPEKEEGERKTEYIIAEEKKPDSTNNLKSAEPVFEERENEGVEVFFTPKRGE